MKTTGDLPLFAPRPAPPVVAGELADMVAYAPPTHVAEIELPDDERLISAQGVNFEENEGSIQTPSDEMDRRPLRPIENRPTTLAQALAEVRAADRLDGNALRQVASDLAMVARLTGVPLESLPCDPMGLRPLLKAVAPARHRMTLSRWATIRSSTARILKFVGWVDDEGGGGTKIGAEWGAAAASLPTHGQKASLRAFARYCIGMGIKPAGVTLETMLAYEAWRGQRTINLTVEHLASTTRRVWRYLQQHHAGWPQGLIPAAHDPRRYALAPDDFPSEFQAEVEDLIRNMAIVKPLDPRFTKKYALATVGNTRASLYRAATIVAAHQGGTASMRSLQDVLSQAAIRIVLNDHFTRVGNDVGWAPSSKILALTLKRCVRLYGKADQVEIDAVAAMVRLVQTPSASLSQKSRSRVVQFHDPAAWQALVDLPMKLFIDAERYRKAGCPDKAARTYERGLQLAILLTHPLRRKNLACLQISEHFRRNSIGQIHRLVISGSETKSGKAIEWMVPPDLADRIDHYLKLYHPLIAGGPSPSMWPGGQGGHKAAETVSRNITALVERELGVAFNVHIIRHLCATFLLEDDPGNGPLAQQMLGHRDPKTTERIYGHARQHGAQKAWGKTLEKRAAEFAAKKPKPTAPPKAPKSTKPEQPRSSSAAAPKAPKSWKVGYGILEDSAVSPTDRPEKED